MKARNLGGSAMCFGTLGTSAIGCEELVKTYKQECDKVRIFALKWKLLKLP